LMVAVPDWARAGVAMFAAVFGVLTYIVDSDVRATLRLLLGSRLRGNDVKSTQAKPPGGRPAAT
jgi:hypothetical protein